MILIVNLKVNIWYHLCSPKKLNIKQLKILLIQSVLSFLIFHNFFFGFEFVNEGTI